MNRHFSLSLVLFALCLLVIVPPLAAQGDAGDLLARVNNLRASLGLPPYSLNGSLGAAASDQAAWMLATSSVTHTRPDGSNPRSRAAAAGYPSQVVSENIYMGGLATVDTAWTFWINSAVHYAGLTNRNYTEIGIGVARDSSGAAYVLVFGNPSGTWGAASSGGSTASGGGASAANNAPPSFVLGQDPNGNIMHQIQDGDTPGQIALIYGYTWEDIPYMMQLNGLTDNRVLQVGSVFLVPPHDGTWTPSAPTSPTAASTSEATAETTPAADLGILGIAATPGAVAGITTDVPPSQTPSATPTSDNAPRVATMSPATQPAGMVGGTAVGVVAVSAATFTPTPTATSEAQSALATAPTAAGTAIASGQAADGVVGDVYVAQQPTQTTPTQDNTLLTVLVIAVLVQTIVIVIAGVEFFRRARR